MRFFDAIAERDRLRTEGVDAIAIEFAGYTGKKDCTVFRSEAELADFKAFHKEWDIRISRLV